MYEPVKYVVEFRNKDHALSAGDIVKALEDHTGSFLRVTVRPVVQEDIAHGTTGPAANRAGEH